jgi:hypothetical protein
LSDVVVAAGGGIPDTGVPTLISQNAIKDLQLALFLENLEVDFFRNGLENLTTWGNTDPKIIDVVSRITSVWISTRFCQNMSSPTAQQERIHVAALESILHAYGQTIVPPCEYSFPVEDLASFLHHGELITSVGIGAIIGLADRIAITDPLLVRSASSIMTVESRHDAFFRHMRGLAPNPSPFDTGIGKIWAFNLALPFVKPGSCHVGIPLPVLPALRASILPMNGTTRRVGFTWDGRDLPSDTGPRNMFIAWVNQLNKPLYSPVTVTADGTGLVSLPRNLTGSVFAALTSQQPMDQEDLEAVTLAGPVIVDL